MNNSETYISESAVDVKHNKNECALQEYYSELIKQKHRDPWRREPKHLQLYDFLFWKLHSKSDYSSAIIASFLIDCEAMNIRNYVTKNGWFMCTSTYIKRRFNFSESTCKRAFDKLESEGFVDVKIRNQHRWVRLNHEVYNAALDEYIKRQKYYYEDNWFELNEFADYDDESEVDERIS